MKNDIVLRVLLSFLIPIVFLYSLFYVTSYNYGGFFAILYSAILGAIGFGLYSVRFGTLRMSKMLPFKIIGFVGLVFMFMYTLITMFILMNYHDTAYKLLDIMRFV